MDEERDASGRSARNSASPDGAAIRRRRCPIVAVGASAGGLEALRAFFGAVSADSGVAFVVITHIQPDRPSLLPELLDRSTPLKVVEAADGLVVEPDTVIVASNEVLTITGGVLRRIDAGPDDAPHHPIDGFFRNLAEDQGDHAVGIVLSGSGSDGALGIRAIKEAGGMAMAQAPGSAKYTGMPDSAIATGLVDFVLDPEHLPGTLVDYCEGSYLRGEEVEADEDLSDAAVHAILNRLRSRLRRDFTYYKKNTIRRRIRRRMAVHRIESAEDYVQLLRNNPRESDLLFRELLISVTSFFRDPDSFAALADEGITRLLDSREDGQILRVWVPGCATGEEAYSIAILLDEQVRKRERIHEVQIFATDLDPSAIEVARAGLYPHGIVEDVSEERLQRHFSREDHAFRVQKNIRDMIVFAVQDVVADPPFTRMDLVVCRNLLIYLAGEAQRRVLSAFHYALRSGGLLFLGSSESVGDSAELFTTVDARHKILQRREVEGNLIPDVGMRGAGIGSGQAMDRATAADPEGKMVARIERYLREIVNPCNVVVDGQNRVVYLQGNSTPLLKPQQGRSRNDLMEMVGDDLATSLLEILTEVRSRGEPAERAAVPLRVDGATLKVDLRAYPLTEPETLRGLTVVSIERDASPSDSAASSTAADPAGETESREELARKLRVSRENLQMTIEEMRSSNEELQSTNEELQSSNEELETSKEEMQSLNEELNTVNSELQSKLDALGRANDDMNNLLNSMQVATIFLDQELRVKRFTEKARDVVRLIESDIGRPLTDLTTTLQYDELVADCRRVLADLVPIEREIRDVKQQWYMVRLLPYRTGQNVISGLVMTMVNIDRAKSAEKASAAAALKSQFFQGIVETLREPLLILDPDLRVFMANEEFHRTFRTRTDEVLGERLFDLSDGRWNIPDLVTLLESIVPAENVLTDYRVEADFPWIGRRRFLLNARQLQQVPDEPPMILLAFGDDESGSP